MTRLDTKKVTNTDLNPGVWCHSGYVFCYATPPLKQEFRIEVPLVCFVYKYNSSIETVNYWNPPKLSEHTKQQREAAHYSYKKRIHTKAAAGALSLGFSALSVKCMLGVY